MATRYETCEITWRRTWFWPVYRFVFVAQAIGPQGMYIAGQSKAVTGPRTPNRFLASPLPRVQQVLAAFVAQLSAQGWEAVTDRGSAWYSYRFRRPVG